MARFVIIEDNAPNLSLMSYLVAAVGHSIEGCRDGRAGLELVERCRPDIVLCDIQLPRLSGLDLVRALRQNPEFKRLPVVAVTALAMRGDREKAEAAGFSGYIEKPIEPETFSIRVESYLPASLRKGTKMATNGASPSPAKPSEAVKLASRNITVLAVDDIPENLNLVQAILQSDGIHVLTARNMHLGLELLRQEKVDLVLSDVNMLAGDGFRFRRAVLAEPSLRRIPFILVSSSEVIAEDREEAAQLGVAQLLERPLEPVKLNAAVAAALGPAREVPAPRKARQSRQGDD